MGRRGAALNILHLYGGRLRVQGIPSPCGSQVQLWRRWEDNPQSFCFSGFPSGRHKVLALHYPCSLCSSCSLHGSHQLAQSSLPLAGWRELLFQCFASALHVLTLKGWCYSPTNFFLKKDEKLTKAKTHTSCKKNNIS